MWLLNREIDFDNPYLSLQSLSSIGLVFAAVLLNAPVGCSKTQKLPMKSRFSCSVVLLQDLGSCRASI